MAITLDDVLPLLNLPIVGKFPTYIPIEFATTSIVLVELLGVVKDDATS